MIKLNTHHWGWIATAASILLILIPSFPIYLIIFTFAAAVGLAVDTIKKERLKQGIGILVANLLILPAVIIVLWVTWIKFEASVYFPKQKSTNNVESINQ